MGIQPDNSHGRPYYSATLAVCLDCFTDRARLAMAVADNFALEQCAKSIIDCGVGRAILDSLAVDLFALLPEIVKLLPRQPFDPVLERDISQRTQTLLAEARRSASNLNHRYVGTEHLVLAMLSVPGIASDFLRQHGATYEKATAAVEEVLRQP